MNYLAHLALAQPTVSSKVGNLLGDFMRGVDREALPEPVYKGLKNHQLVDCFTDQHPQVRACKSLFAPERRRFAGVALDVLFDHFLVRHWSGFHELPLTAFIARDYQLLQSGEPLMPDSMRLITQRMRQGNWLASYASLDAVAVALQRIAGRIRFENHFAQSIYDIQAHYPELEQVFLGFYPQLQVYVASRALERAG